MDETFQRLFTRTEPQVLSLNVQAALGPVRAPERSQFSLLVRHFLERFFNHETASPDGDAKTRLVQIAFATGLPGLLVATYLWPAYHPFKGWPPGSDGSPPTYWLQVNHHFFYVVYSFVAMGIVTVFEWDLFFPDLLDIFILGSLPVAEMRVFLSRVAAISVFIAGFLFDINIMAPLVLPLAMDPPSLSRFLIGHLIAVAGSGLFAAAFILALQGVLLSVLGERLFRKLSLAIQGLSITVLLMLMLLFPVLSGVVPVLLQSGSIYARCVPPFWFLGIYQRLLDGPSALPIYTTLAQTGCWATLSVVAVAIVAYPLAYMRRVKQLVVGAATRSMRSRIAQPFNHLLHATAVRPPVRRAVFHFISQTLLRVPRYRIYLVLYGGAGLSVVAAGVLRFVVTHQQVHLEISVDGIRAALGVIPFWVIAGMRMAFVSAGNQRGNWVYRIVHGNRPHFHPAMEQLLAAKVWVLLCAMTITGGACLVLQIIAPPEMRTWPTIAAQVLVAAGMCVLMTDIFFMYVNIVAFTGTAAREKSNLAFTVLKFFTFFPLVAWIPVAVEPWVESSILHLAEAAAAIAIVHLLMRYRHRTIVKEHSSQLELEDDEEDFPMKLGLRY
jgi:hypothetical protein